MILRNKGFSVKYFGRLAFLLNAGIWSSIFSITEKKRFAKQLKNAKTPDDPLIIIGNWRTGTTLLHQLLAQDPQFTTPTVYQVSNPDHFLISKKYYKPIMSKALGNKRPMDNVKLGIDEPQEDEYALLKTLKNTPLEELLFSGKTSFFNPNKMMLPSSEEQQFIQQIRYFCKKLAFNKNARVLLKNPFHSMRINALIKAFPGAQFIHITRDPEAVIPSAIHMWNIVGKQNMLKGNFKSPSVKEIANTYNVIVNEVRKSFKTLDKTQKIEVKFENLEKYPVNCINNIYQQLNIEFTPEYEKNLKQYCEALKKYKKNRYNLSSQDKSQIKNMLSETLPEYFSKQPGITA